MSARSSNHKRTRGSDLKAGLVSGLGRLRPSRRGRRRSVAGAPTPGAPGAGVGAAGTAGRPNRLEQLAKATSGLGRKARGIQPERVMFLVGCLLFPIGILIVFLGWYGAAHTPYLFEQIPYLISGGLIGLGLVLVGGFLYFGDWLARIGRQQQQADERTLAVLSRLETALTVLATGTGGSSTPALSNGQEARPPRGVEVSSSSRARRSIRPGGLSVADGGPVADGGVRTSPGLVATARGTMVHRMDCTIVLNKEGLRPVELGASGFTPCKICGPTRPH
ncbi:MAG: hypothetical protein ACRD0I_00415 [Acidimicrobiales bacterium]